MNAPVQPTRTLLIGFATCVPDSPKLPRDLGPCYRSSFAERDELIALAQAMQRTGSGVFELIPAGTSGSLEEFGGEPVTGLP